MTTATATTIDRDTLVSRNIRLTGEHMRMVLDDPSLLDTIPDDAELVLLPDDDPAVFEANLRIGVDALRRGEEVVFRHIRHKTGG